MSEAVPDPDRERLQFAARLEEADIRTRRFIDVRDGEKGTRTRAHQQPENWLEADAPGLSGNYGVHSGHGLIELDLDDYDDTYDTSAVDALPETFTVASPHTDDDAPGHRYYAVEDGEAVLETLQEITGTNNPKPSWGEIKYSGQYVVGPGSQLDGCSKEWCEECETPDGGRYRIAEDRPIATISAADIRAILLADPKILERQSASDLFDIDDEEDGEGGNEDTEGDYDGEEWVTEAVAEDALDHIDPDCEHPEWITIGFALVNHFGESTGGRLFDQWSHGGAKYDARHVDTVIDDANGYDADVRYLIAAAKRHGWDASAAARAALASGAARSDSEEDDADASAEDDDQELPTPPALSGMDVHNGGYGVWEQTSDGEQRWNKWTNFQLELTSVLHTEGGGSLLRLTVHPVSESEGPYDVEVEPTDLNEPRSLRRHVCTGRTTTFQGGHEAVNTIKHFVGAQEATRKRAVSHMGYDTESGLWITPQGALGPDGWIDDPDIVYSAQGIGAERKWRLHPESGSENEDTDGIDYEAVREMVRLLPQTRAHERLLPLLGWFCAASVRPLIMEWDDEFNLMSVTGETGAGKTTTIGTLWELFGMDSEPMSADTTEFVLLSTLSATNSIPIWFDEYKPSDMSDGQVNQFLNELRKTTRGGYGERGNADLSSGGFQLHAPVVVSGEERIRGSAEERRAIFTSLKKSSTRGEYAEALTELGEAGDPSQHALAWIQWLTGRDRAELEGLWEHCGEHVDEMLAEYETDNLEDLVIQGLQTIQFGCALYRHFARSLGIGADAEQDSADEEDALPVTLAEIDDAIIYVLTTESGGLNRTSHLDVLFEVAARAAAADYLTEGEEYRFVHKERAGEELRINISRAYDQIKRYARDHDVTEDLLHNHRDYADRITNDDGETPWLVTEKQYTEDIGTAVGIDPEAAEHDLDEFGRWMFDESMSGARRERWQALSTNAQGRINVTATATYVEADREELPEAIAERGTLTDQTKAMDYVVFASDRAAVPPLEEGAHYAITGARRDEYEGDPQIVLDSGVSEVREAEAGYEFIPSADPGPNRTLAGETATDGDGSALEQASAIVHEIVAEDGPCTAAHVIGRVASDSHAIDLDRVKPILERLKTDGRIVDLGDGYETL